MKEFKELIEEINKIDSSNLSTIESEWLLEAENKYGPLPEDLVFIYKSLGYGSIGDSILKINLLREINNVYDCKESKRIDGCLIVAELADGHYAAYDYKNNWTFGMIHDFNQFIPFGYEKNRFIKFVSSTVRNCLANDLDALNIDGYKKAPGVQFEDYGMRLLVIDSLMYEFDVIKPKLTAREFAKNFTGRDIDIEEVGYSPIPEIVDYLNQIEIKQEWLTQITEIIQEANPIYQAVVPLDDISHTVMWEKIIVNSSEDLKLLPNLKRIYLYEGETGRNWLLDEFESKGVEANWL